MGNCVNSTPTEAQRGQSGGDFSDQSGDLNYGGTDTGGIFSGNGGYDDGGGGGGDGGGDGGGGGGDGGGE